MNSLMVIAVSMMLAVVSASPCSDSCLGACDIANTNCQGGILFGGLCAAANGGCVAGCGAVCGCLDGCDAQCKPDFDTCRAAAGDNIILRTQCTANYDLCSINCQALCSITTAWEALGSILGGGGSQLAGPPPRK